MKRLLIGAAAALALALPLGGCGDLKSAQGQADTLDAAWLLAKATGTAYIASCAVKPSLEICSDAVVGRVRQALAIGDQDVAAAKVAILAAGSDASAMSKAVTIGLAAITAFQNTIVGLGVDTPKPSG